MSHSQKTKLANKTRRLERMMTRKEINRTSHWPREEKKRTKRKGFCQERRLKKRRPSLKPRKRRRKRNPREEA